MIVRFLITENMLFQGLWYVYSVWPRSSPVAEHLSLFLTCQLALEFLFHRRTQLPGGISPLRWFLVEGMAFIMK